MYMNIISNTTIDSVLIGQRFENLIEKKKQLEHELKKEQSKCRTHLWNNKEEKENQYKKELENLKKQKHIDLCFMQQEYTKKKDDYETKYIEKIQFIRDKMEEVNTIYRNDVESLRNKYKIKVDEKKGELFKVEHLQVVGVSKKNIELHEFL